FAEPRAPADPTFQPKHARQQGRTPASVATAPLSSEPATTTSASRSTSPTVIPTCGDVVEDTQRLAAGPPWWRASSSASAELSGRRRSQSDRDAQVTSRALADRATSARPARRPPPTAADRRCPEPGRAAAIVAPAPCACSRKAYERRG